MAKIIKLNLNEKIINPIKTTRKSNTNPFENNPFKYQDFEGNTLPVAVCADVFVGKTNKLKMISSSVMGSMTKLHKSITEPIINLVNRVKDGITNTWTTLKNTNVELPGLKNIGEGIYSILNYDVGKGLSDSINNLGTGIGKGISGTMNLLNKDVTEIGQDLSGTWTSLISRIHTGNKKPSANMPVAEVKEMLQIALDNEKSAKEISLNTTNKMKEQVA